MVGALRRGGIPQSPALHRAAAHIHGSPGRPTCLRQTLPLSFVFGPERSLTQFKEVCYPPNTPWWPGGPSSLESTCRTGRSSLKATSSPHRLSPTLCLEAPLSGKRPSASLPRSCCTFLGMLVSASPGGRVS